MKKAAKINVKGIVQGVFFRNYIKENAESLKLNGFVRNLNNNNVEIVIEGDIENVDKMCELCKTGPKHAIIKNVEAIEIPFQDFKDFKVLHI